MPFMSSPIAYPQTSSPTTVAPKRIASGALKCSIERPQDMLVESPNETEGEASEAPPNDREEPAAKRRLIDDNEHSNNWGGTKHHVAACQATSKVVGGFIMDDSDGEDSTSDVLPRLKRDMSTAYAASSADAESSISTAIPQAGETEVNDGISLDLNNVTSLTFTTSEKATSHRAVTCSGATMDIRQLARSSATSFERMVAARSTTKASRGTKSYYGVEVHALIAEALAESGKKDNALHVNDQAPIPSVESSKTRNGLMWTEKYRARNFMELVGDDRTHRQVLRWLKQWDSIVFPKMGTKSREAKSKSTTNETQRAHRKILMLTGPPGLGKTTLAHVCARQAGYEVLEINASDERSSAVVKGRIRTAVGTENVKTGSTRKTRAGEVRNAAHPLCVVVDEVDGVVTGSGGSGDGGFVKALIDLINLDQKNCSQVSGTGVTRKKKASDKFKLMRPLILICNDIYHASLRPLRQSGLAEVIHIRKPPLDAVAVRMKGIFEKEGIMCDVDASRRLCEACWGLIGMDAKRRGEGAGEGDMRSIMVVGEWIATKLKNTNLDRPKLTRKWIDTHVATDFSSGTAGNRGIGRGGAREIVQRIFIEGAGFPRPTALTNTTSHAAEQPQIFRNHGVSEVMKKAGVDALRSIIDTAGDTGPIMTEIFASYPHHEYNDDNALSKPNECYDWLHFHDMCSSRVFSNQEFELAGYLSVPVLASHCLFAGPRRSIASGHGSLGGHEHGSYRTATTGDDETEQQDLPFTGPKADHEAYEQGKENRALLLEVQAKMMTQLQRSFRSIEEIASDLLPWVARMLSPDVRPTIVGSSGDSKGVASVRREPERQLVRKAVDVMLGFGVDFKRGRLEDAPGSVSGKAEWIYRMYPPLDHLTTFLTTGSGGTSNNQPTRYAVRQLLDQEHGKALLLQAATARQARFDAAGSSGPAEGGAATMLPPNHPLARQLRMAAAVDDKENEVPGSLVNSKVKRDFFGRVIATTTPLGTSDGNKVQGGDHQQRGADNETDTIHGPGVTEKHKVWVTYHEGFSNAVRKPITLSEFLGAL